MCNWSVTGIDIMQLIQSLVNIGNSLKQSTVVCKNSEFET